MRLPRFFLYLGWLAITASAATVDPARALDGLDIDVGRAMTELQAPGAAVGVIRDGKVIWAKGYGAREIGKPAVVTADTIFAVGSMSKSFTAITVALMVDEHKLD